MGKRKQDGTTNTPKPRRIRRNRDEVFTDAEEVFAILRRGDTARRNMVLALVNARFGAEDLVPEFEDHPGQLRIEALVVDPAGTDNAVPVIAESSTEDA